MEVAGSDPGCPLDEFPSVSPVTQKHPHEVNPPGDSDRDPGDAPHPQQYQRMGQMRGPISLQGSVEENLT